MHAARETVGAQSGSRLIAALVSSLAIIPSSRVHASYPPGLYCRKAVDRIRALADAVPDTIGCALKCPRHPISARHPLRNNLSHTHVILLVRTLDLRCNKLSLVDHLRKHRL